MQDMMFETLKLHLFFHLVCMQFTLVKAKTLNRCMKNTVMHDTCALNV